MKISLEKAARAVLGKDDDELIEGHREHGIRPKVSLARVAFLEMPVPNVFSDPIPPPRPELKPKRKRASKTAAPVSPVTDQPASASASTPESEKP